MTVRVRTPVRQTARRIRIRHQDDWERIGRRHFLTRDAFESVRRLTGRPRPGWFDWLRPGR